MGMTLRFPFLALPALLAISSLHALAAGTQEQEYQQERTIALRDPKVRAAYEEADRKLDAKILQIDPALADYLHHRAAATTAAPVAKKAAAPAATPVAKKPFMPATTPATGKTYVVKKGNTLSAIASHSGVTVAALKSANKTSMKRNSPSGRC